MGYVGREREMEITKLLDKDGDERKSSGMDRKNGETEN